MALALAAFVAVPAGAAPPAPAFHDALDLQVADLDRDGCVDLVALHSADHLLVRIHAGDRNGGWTAGTEELPLRPGGAPAQVGRITVADLNGDGRPDLVVTAGGREAFVVWNRFWHGRGNFHLWSRTPLAAERPVTSTAGDLDADGLVDLVLHGAETKVYWGSATRTFVTHVPTPLTAGGQPVSRVPVQRPLAAATATPPRIADAEHMVIHREAGRYSAFPALYHVKGERDVLHVHFGAAETTSHVESRKRQHDFVSHDGGRTWQRAERRQPNPAWRSRAGRLVNADTYFWRHVPKERRAELEALGYEVRNAPDGSVTYCAGCVLRTSEDDGVTWQERELEVPGQAIINGYHDSAATLRLDERTLLRAVFGKPAARVLYYESWLLRSEDDGATWTFGTIAADPTRDDRGFSETALAQAADGDVVAMMRIEPPMGTRLWVARSADRGKTWGSAQETPLRGFPAHLLRLRDGRLLCTYGHRETPIGIRAAISRDHGRTWREEDIVTLRDDGSGSPGDNGYPLTAELADGTLVTVYYLTRDAVTGVEATRWRNPWL